MSPSFFTSSVSKCSLRSLSRATGMISRSANSRAVSRISCCSSVSSKSIMRGVAHPTGRGVHSCAAGTPHRRRSRVSIRITQQALDDQAVLRDHVGHFLLDAHAMPGLDLGARIDVIERTAAFLVEMLLPHAAAEEHVLYPGATRLLGCADEQTTVNEDRAAVRELLGRLAFADPADAGALQEILYALYALLSAHFWREEQVLM